MEQALSVRKETTLQTSDVIEHAVCNIYEAHPHETKFILFTAISLIFGYSAYKEYELITRAVDEEEA